MFTYDPEKFASLFAAPGGAELLAYLREPTSIAAPEAASWLGRPAIMGVRTSLMEAFGARLQAYRFRKMAGHMVHQILADRGWAIDDPDAHVRAVPFVKAASYVRPGLHTFHVFRNRDVANEVCISRQRRGAPLPKDAQWAYHTHFWTPLEAEIAFDLIDFPGLVATIATAGYQRLTVDMFDA
jgi:hypothetical protein